MFYVYEWYIVNTGEVIYVGKGTRLRYKVRKHNRFFNEIIKRYECESRIVKEFDNELDAFNYEYDRIKELKDIGQCVCNIRDGGFGGNTSWWTDEYRKRYSEHNVMKSIDQRKRMSEFNPMKNKQVAKKCGTSKSRAVIIGDVEYRSIKDATSALGVTSSTIATWCRKGMNRNGEKCRYKDSEQVEFTDKRYNKSSCKPMTYKGKHYESPRDLASELNCGKDVIYGWLRVGFDTYGNPVRYDEDNRDLVFSRLKGRSHPVIVNGKHYKSISEASRDLNVSAQWLGDILSGKHKSKKYICTYDNQQPSQGNTDNSTLEGSTTNR